MATEKTFVSLTGLTAYDEKIKAKMADDDAAALAAAKSYADGLASNYDAAGTAETKVNALANGAVKSNTDAIAEINNETTGILAQAKSYADGKANTAETNAKTYADGKIGTVAEGKTVVEMIAEAKSEATYDDTALAARVTANESAITVLNGEGEGSVKKAVADGIAGVVAGADADFDTLKEVADWIKSDTVGAAKMQSNIATLMGADTVEGSVAKALKDAKAYTDEKDTAMDARVDVLEAAIGEGGSVASQIATEIGKLDATVESDAVEAGKGVKVTVVETDGKLTSVAVAGDFSAMYDAKGAAATAETNAKTYADGLAVNYATAAQGAKADTAVQSVASGTANGTISVDGTDVAVKGLGTAAYESKTAFDAAGTAETKVNELANGAVKTNSDDITAIKGRLDTLEAVSYREVTVDEINALFVTA